MSSTTTAKQPGVDLSFDKLVQAVCSLPKEQWLELCRQRDENDGNADRQADAEIPGEEGELDDWLDEMEAMLAEEGYDLSHVPSLAEVRAGLSGIRGTMAQAVREEREARG